MSKTESYFVEFGFYFLFEWFSSYDLYGLIKKLQIAL